MCLERDAKTQTGISGEREEDARNEGCGHSDTDSFFVVQNEEETGSQDQGDSEGSEEETWGTPGRGGLIDRDANGTRIDAFHREKRVVRSCLGKSSNLAQK